MARLDELTDRRIIAALRRANGGLGKAGRELHVPPDELRRFIAVNRYLMDRALAIAERQADEAAAVIIEALRSPEPRRRLEAAAYIIRRRGKI